jgi:hypothetical protein
MLDDCWAGKNRTASGAITEDKSRFPSGMKVTIVVLIDDELMFAMFRTSLRGCIRWGSSSRSTQTSERPLAEAKEKKALFGFGVVYFFVFLF